MEILSNFSYNLGWFLVVLTIVVFFHELGHYAVARWCGVRVEVFSIGFGPEIFGRTAKSGTRWRFSAIPLGGYVKFFGDASAVSDQDAELIDKMSADERAVSFHHKSVPQRAAIIAAGPIANFILSVIIATGIFMALGKAVTPPVVGEVSPDSAAEAAGLLAGDRIVQIDAHEIRSFEDIPDIVRDMADVPLLVIVDRKDEILEFTVTPQRVEIEDRLGNIHVIGRIGISIPSLVIVEMGPVGSAVAAIEFTYDHVVATLKSLGQIITGQRSAKELGGPIMIAQISGMMAEDGLPALMRLIVILSATLGLINLFPIPVLDGGHLLFICFEAVRGKPLGERAQGYGIMIGLAMVISLMVFVTFNDLTRPSTLEFFRNLIG